MAAGKPAILAGCEPGGTMAEAEAIDKAEDAQYGKGKRGDELPEELKRRDTRLKKIRAAKAALEAEAKLKAEAEAEEARRRIAERERQEGETGKKIGGVPPRIPDPEAATPSPKAQKNFTDPESRIMLDGATKSFQQSFNAQIAVDSTSQIIVATAVTQDAVDNGQLVPLLVSVGANTGRLPTVATADNGYFSEAAITDERLAGIDLYVATGRERKAAPPLASSDAVAIATAPPPQADNLRPTLQPLRATPPPTVIQQMREKLATDTGKATYKLRKSVVEPVFGQIKEVRGFRRFSFRGLAKVAAEWDLVALTHNLLKLFRSGWSGGAGQVIRNVARTGAGRD